jgi:uridine kinase
MTASPVRQIVKRNGSVVPYDRERIAVAIAKALVATGRGDRALADRFASEVEAHLAASYPPGVLPTVEDIQDAVEATLMRGGQLETARSYIIYRHERAKSRAARMDRFEATDNIPYKKIYEVLLWNMDHDCETVDGLNRIVRGPGLRDFVRQCDARYAEEVRRGAEKVIERLPEVRIVIIAGPSSSGKTTTTIKLSETLAGAGYELVSLAVDHYFFDLAHHPKDEFGDYDYETPHALDLELINRHLIALLDGQTIRTPHYDFKTGTRTLDVHELSLRPKQILLIDSLHGLYEGMTYRIPAASKFRLYIETLGQLRDASGNFMRWADNRLLRRMIRDSWNRNLQPVETIAHWHYVRRSELQHIIPFIGTVDYLVNSALPYEIPVLQHRLFPYLPRALEAFHDEPRRQDAYIRALRLHDLLRQIEPIADDSAIDKRSLLREFIGGSEYTY